MDQAIGIGLPTFMGEWGNPSYPNYDSVMSYLPDNEKNVWPAPAGGSFEYHTPVFNTKDCVNRLDLCARPFVANNTMLNLIWGSQLSQATIVRRVTDRMRSGWPNNTGALHYKLNDNYPAASWATIDWYGVPKMSYYMTQDTLAPLHATLVATSTNYYNQAFSLPVYLFDDSDTLYGSNWQVKVRAYNSNMDLIKTVNYEGSGAITNGVKNLGNFSLTAAQTATAPLMIVCDVRKNGVLQDRVYDWYNYEQSPGCILDSGGTTLSTSVNGNNITVTNTGSRPAVGVNFVVPASGAATFTCTDNYFWLDAGESKTVTLNSTTGVTVSKWNNRSGVNYAAGSTATADTATYPANQAVDNQWVAQDVDSWVSTGATSSHWLKLDLGYPRLINKFVINHVGVSGDANYNTRDFNIQGSNDGTNWSSALVTVTGNTQSSTTHTITPATYRYFRLNVTNCNGGRDNFARIYEMQAWGTTDINLALNGTTATADTVTFPVSQAVDGKWAGQNNDAWVSIGATSSHWLRLDLGQSRTICSFLIKNVGVSGDPLYNTRDFNIQLSSDGTN